MLYPYKYPKAKIQSFQSFVNYIMLEVVLKARKIPDAVFSDSLIIPKYVQFVRDINPKYIKEPIANMFVIAKSLDSFHLKLLRKAVYENNRIEELCKGNYTPIRYKYLNGIFLTPQEKKMLWNIKAFCNYLYERCLTLAPIYSKYGMLKAYHDLLVQDDDTCHSCGNASMLTTFSTVRNAFDHYLAKQTYPFVSVNFKNLVPACNICNSQYKKSKDVLEFRGKRRKAFYPFTKEAYEIKFQIAFQAGFIYSDAIEPRNIRLRCTCLGHQEEVENWMRVYNIQEQYKAKCCNSTFKSYLSSIIDDTRVKKRSINESLSLFEQNINADMNFLKVPFFRAALETLGIK